MAGRERRLSAIMFTDIVGFTRLGQVDEAQALAILDEHRRILRPVFDSHGGREVKTMGDGFLVEFASAVEAIRAAVAMQTLLHERNEKVSPADSITIRIGLHVGDVVHDGTDVYGDAVNVASRIEPLAEPGGVCLSERLFLDVRNKVDCPMVSIGQRELKNVAEPVEIYRLVLPWMKHTSPAPLRLERRRIAVLPLLNVGGDPADEYFADGMTEELIAALSAVEGLRVISRTSIIRYKGTAKGVSEIARELNVGTVVEGSVRKVGRKVRISVQLIDATKDEHLWSRQYDRELEDILAVQADIANHAAQSLGGSLVPKPQELSRGARPIDPDAHTLYLKGRFSANKRTEEGLRHGIELFQEALARHPGYALAHAGLAESYLPLAVYCYLAPHEGMPRAKASAERALAIDPSLLETWAVVGAVRSMYEWDWAGGMRELGNALETNPNLPRPRQILSECLLAFGRFAEAEGEARRALELDPLSLPINTDTALIAYYHREYSAAIQECEVAVEIDDRFFPARMYKALACARLGMFREAIEEVEQAQKFAHGGSFVLGAVGEIHALAGRREAAERVLDDLTRWGNTHYVSGYSVARIWATLGETEPAWTALERAVADHCAQLRFLPVDPAFDRLRDDPRYSATILRLGLAV